MAEATEITRTRRLEVVDERGRARIVLGEEAEETFGVALLDKRGHARMWLSLHYSGPSLSFSEDGNIRAAFGNHDDGPNTVVPGPYLVLCDEQGATAWECRVSPDGQVSVEQPDDLRH